MKKTLFNCLLGILVIFDLAAQTLSEKEVQKDLDFLVESIMMYDPALLKYNPDYLKNVKEEISDPSGSISLNEHFKIVTRVISLANEGHFGIGDWEDDVHKGFMDNTIKYLPMSVRIIDNKIFVWSDYSNNPSMERGDEILSINGLESGELLKELYKYVHADGEIVSYKEEQLTAGFNWMYYLYIDQPEKFQIKVQKQDGSTPVATTIDALTREEHFSNYESIYGKSEDEEESVDDMYTFKTEDTYAVLTLKSFDHKLMEKYDVKPAKLYKEVFSSLKEANCEHLIIDLRNNRGGRNEFSDKMLPFVMLSDRKGSYKITTSWEGQVKKYPFPGRSKSAFEGQVIVLINGGTYSAGSTLALYLREFADAIVVGQESGTRYEGYAAGSSQVVVLPHSRFKISIPRYLIENPGINKQKTTNRGVMPDHIVDQDIEDLINEKDPVMEKAMELIAQK